MHITESISSVSPVRVFVARFPKAWPSHLMILFIISLATALRLSNLDAFSLTLDETTLVQFAKGVLERGYPYIYVGSMEVPLATYELVPYPIAVSIWLFGINDFAIRLPAALFGVATTYLIYRATTNWFGWRAAMFAALLYALSPWAIYWAQNCFHPAQAQFFAFLTIMQVRTLLHNENVPARTYYLAALCFILAFLSWEGMGFLLPVMFVTGLIVNWGEWRWLKNRHLWFASGVVTLVVIIQGVRRILLQHSYLMVGSGKSEVSLPQLVFTHSDYNPWFYISNFFGTESHIVLSFVFVIGLIYISHSWSLRFVYAAVLGGIFFMTNFLAFYSEHYVFWLLPLFLIAVSATTIITAQKLSTGASFQLWTARAAQMSVIVLLITIELASASSYGLRPYELSEEWKDPQRDDIRRGLAGIDYRGLVEAFKKEYRPEDVVITLASYPMDIYGAGTKGDYFLQSVTGQKVIYDPESTMPYYVDKYSGNPVLRSRAELEELLFRHKRVWLLAAPYGVFSIIQDRDLLESINTQMSVRAESYDGILYLWDKTGTSASLGAN